MLNSLKNEGEGGEEKPHHRGLMYGRIQHRIPLAFEKNSDDYLRICILFVIYESIPVKKILCQQTIYYYSILNSS